MRICRYVLICFAIVFIMMSNSISQDKYNPSRDDPFISIHKTLMGNEGKDPFIDSQIFIKVTISTKNQHLKYLNILESVDPQIKVISHSRDYISQLDSSPTGMPQISESLKELASELPVDDDKFSFKKTSINPGNEIMYVYHAVPETPGPHVTKTEVEYRIGNTTNVSDLELQLNILEKNPTFDISINPKKTQAECNEDILVSYNIKYLGGDDCNTCEYLVNIDNSKEYFINRSAFRQSFPKNSIIPIEISIRYYNAGEFMLPGIRINNKKYEPIQPVGVSIMSPSDKYINNKTLGIASISISLLSFIANLYLRRKEKTLENGIEIKFKEMNEQINFMSNKIENIENKSKKEVTREKKGMS